MTLREQIDADIREAMRQRARARLEALRFLKSAIQLAEKAQGIPLEESAVVEVITKQANDRRESIRMFQQGNRADLVDKESAELAILEAYLPARFTHDELVELVRAAIEEMGATSARDRGRVMGRLMPQVRGRADGAEVNDLVGQLLESGG